jgi:hypothetical protein
MGPETWLPSVRQVERARSMSNATQDDRRSRARSWEPLEPSADHTIEGRRSGIGFALCSLPWHVERQHHQATPNLVGIAPLVEHPWSMRSCFVCYKRSGRAR